MANKIIDLCTYNCERDLLQMRFDMLDFVDTFIVVESHKTFSGKDKEIAYKPEDFKTDKEVIHLIADIDDPELVQEAKNSRLVTNEHFMRAYIQKEYAKKLLKDFNRDDTLYYGDVDEFYNPTEFSAPTKIRQYMYGYYLNMRSSEEWAGTVVGKVGDIIDKGINNSRADQRTITKSKNGWHFTNIGGIDALKKKLESYDHQEVNTPEVMGRLEFCIKNGVDFLGRPTGFWIDESDWPEYLKLNKHKYEHLCKS